MDNVNSHNHSYHQGLRISRDSLILLGIALATVVVHLLTGNRYGFQRDELATLDDARHLAWGFVAYPPITPFFGRLSLEIFGTSLMGFRFFAALAQAVAVVLTGLMAREMGGRLGAQIFAALAAVPFCLAGGALMQYVSFDYLCWVLSAYFVVRLLKSENPRWWLAVGGSMGLGMMAKYGMAFFAFGVISGLVLTGGWRHLKSRWFWWGAGLTLLIFAPNLIWQAQHHFISLDFLRSIHARDVRIGRTKNFLPEQLALTLLAFPLFLAGLYYCLFSSAGQRFRLLGWMYIVPLVVFVAAKGRAYYLAAAYPMLYAAGSVWGEGRIGRLRPFAANLVRVVAWAALTFDIVFVAAFFLPVAPVNSHWWSISSRLQGDYVEEIGWPELAESVARIRDGLPQADRARLGILAGNYGEAGAIDLYGPRYGLPQAISGTNSYWFRGYGDPTPETLIVLGFDGDFLDRNFSSCQVAGHTWNRYRVKNEETEDHPDIYVCRGLKQSWAEFWKGLLRFG